MLRSWTGKGHEHIQFVLRYISPKFTIDENTFNKRVRATHAIFLNKPHHLLSDFVNREMVEETLAMLETFQSIIANSPKFTEPSHIYLFCGIRPIPQSDIIRKLQNMDVDECFVDHGFSATTYIFKKAKYFAEENEGIVLNIQIPASSSLLFVDSMTD